MSQRVLRTYPIEVKVQDRALIGLCFNVAYSVVCEKGEI